MRLTLALAATTVFLPAFLPAATVTTLIGTGVKGYSETQVNNPYGMTIGPDGAMYFCDLDNQRIRRLDLKTKQLTTVAGNGERTYKGDGGPATEASINMPHELLFDKAGNLYFAERDNHVVRKVDMKTHLISTVAGTGVAGFSGDGGPGNKAQINQPHSIVIAKDGSMLICDIANHRIRRLDLKTGVIETWGGTGETKPTPDGAPIKGTPLNGPRTFAVAPNGDLYLALREGNVIFRIDWKKQTLHRIAGTGEPGWQGDGGPALQARVGGAIRFGGPKGLALSKDNKLYIADTENQVIRMVDLKTGIISTVLGSGKRGDGPETAPAGCAMNRPHGVLFANGLLYVSDSENHRIRVLKF
jgi:sugar lactone lactonase YvrE